MTAAKLLTIPTSGRFIVDTDIDTYDVDCDTGIGIWHDMAREGRGEVVEPELFLFDTVECTVGCYLQFDVGRVGERFGSRVLGITPHREDVAA